MREATPDFTSGGMLLAQKPENLRQERYKKQEAVS